MPKGFIGRWRKRKEPPSLTNRIKSIGSSPGSLKQQITDVIKQIDIQVDKLDRVSRRFGKRDSTIFKRVVRALSERDTSRANILASELSEIRKVEKMLMHAKLAMESVSMRLNTVSELGDIVTAIAPAANVLGNIQSEMADVFPEANYELENIGGLLNEIAVSTTQTSGMSVNAEAANTEAEKILEEAEKAAEEHIKQQLPDVSREAPVKKSSLKT